MIDTHLLLSEDDYEWLRRRAYEEHKSLAEVVREIIRHARQAKEGGGPGDSLSQPVDR